MTGQDTTVDKPSMGERVKEELYKYGVVSGYLFICFSLLLLYGASTSGGAQQPLSFTMALVKALVLGKFLLIGDAMKAGSRAERHPLLVRVAWKTFAFLVVLLVFKALEEWIIGLVHHKPVLDIVNEVMNRTVLENLAPVLIMLLILIPLISISESYRQLGHERFRALWLSRPDGLR